MEGDYDLDPKISLLSQKRKIKDQTDTKRWKKKIGKTRFDFTLAFMQKYGPKQFQRHYVNVGMKIAKNNNLPFPRVCQRVKDALVCWYSDFWFYCLEVIKNGIPDDRGNNDILQSYDFEKLELPEPQLNFGDYLDIDFD